MALRNIDYFLKICIRGRDKYQKTNKNLNPFCNKDNTFFIIKSLFIKILNSCFKIFDSKKDLASFFIN